MQKAKKEQTFWDHFIEVRSRLKVILITLIGTTVFFLIFPADPSDFLNPSSFFTGLYRPAVSIVLQWIKNYVAPSQLQIISLEIGAPLEVYMFGALFLGIIVSSPVIAYEIYMFVDPALHPHERRAVYPFVIGFTALFLAGALFGFFLLAPFIAYTLILFSQFVGSQPVISVLDFYSMVLTTVGLTGVGFTVPIIFVLLVKFGVVKTSLLTKNRKYVYFGVFVLTAIITPDGGPLADIALFLPIIALLEVAILIAKRYEKPIEGNKCKFCGHGMKSSPFCPKCGKYNSYSAH